MNGGRPTTARRRARPSTTGRRRARGRGRRAARAARTPRAAARVGAAVRRDLLGEAHVGEERVARRVEQHVLRLEVAVDEAAVVEGAEGEADAGDVVAGVRLGHLAAPLEQREHVAARRALHDEVERGGVLEGGVERRHVRVEGERPERLLLERHARRGVERQDPPLVQRLQRVDRLLARAAALLRPPPSTAARRAPCTPTPTRNPPPPEELAADEPLEPRRRPLAGARGGGGGPRLLGGEHAVHRRVGRREQRDLLELLARRERAATAVITGRAAIEELKEGRRSFWWSSVSGFAASRCARRSSCVAAMGREVQIASRRRRFARRAGCVSTCTCRRRRRIYRRVRRPIRRGIEPPQRPYTFLYHRKTCQRSLNDATCR